MIIDALLSNLFGGATMYLLPGCGIELVKPLNEKQEENGILKVICPPPFRLS